MHLSREYAEALGIDFDRGCLRADAPKARPAVRALVIPGEMPPTLNENHEKTRD